LERIYKVSEPVYSDKLKRNMQTLWNVGQIGFDISGDDFREGLTILFR
jgi:hypothetical protein